MFGSDFDSLPMSCRRADSNVSVKEVMIMALSPDDTGDLGPPVGPEPGDEESTEAEPATDHLV